MLLCWGMGVGGSGERGGGRGGLVCMLSRHICVIYSLHAQTTSFVVSDSNSKE